MWIQAELQRKTQLWDKGRAKRRCYWGKVSIFLQCRGNWDLFSSTGRAKGNVGLKDRKDGGLRLPACWRGLAHKHKAQTWPVWLSFQCSEVPGYVFLWLHDCLVETDLSSVGEGDRNWRPSPACWFPLLSFAADFSQPSKTWYRKPAGRMSERHGRGVFQA